jgi:hypothetical protein
MQRKTSTRLIAGLAAIVMAASAMLSCKKEISPIYSYAVERSIGEEEAKELAVRLNPVFEENDKEFIKIISAYPKPIQKACINSDILNNHSISDKELENAKKATLEGIVNPEETYGVLANGDTFKGGLGEYSQKNVEFAIGNVLALNKYLESRGVDDKHITLLIRNSSNVDLYNNAATKLFGDILPKKGEQIAIDGDSTGENFKKATHNLPSDYNDTLYILTSNPAPAVSKSERDSHGDSDYIIFPDGAFFSTDFVPKLPDEYKRAIIITNSWYSRNFSCTLNLNASNKRPRNIMAIASPNDASPENETCTMDLVSRMYKNPKSSIEELFGKLKFYNEPPKVYYYNEEGVLRNAQECPWFKEPFKFN